MTQEQALEKLEQLVKEKQVFKQSLAYHSALRAIKNPGTPIECGEHGGTRWASKSWQMKTAIILHKIGGIKFENSNNAPKGGKHGDRITVFFE